MNAKIQGKVVNDLANEVLRRCLGNQDFWPRYFGSVASVGLICGLELATRGLELATGIVV